MSDREERQSPVDRILSWLSGQPFNNVLIFVLIAGGGYALTYEVPKHLRQIQDGYREVIRDSDERHSKEREVIRETYDRWFDRRTAGK